MWIELVLTGLLILKVLNTVLNCVKVCALMAADDDGEMPPEVARTMYV
jgi:hypothetical protein